MSAEGMCVRVRGTVAVGVSPLDDGSWAAWVDDWRYGFVAYGASPWDAICRALKNGACDLVREPDSHIVMDRRREFDALRVVRDQARYIASLEAQLLPHLVHETPTEQGVLA